MNSHVKIYIKIVNFIHKTFTPIKPDKSSAPLALSKEQLGRNTWSVLHSMAAAYPKNPTEEDKDNCVAFLHSLY